MKYFAIGALALTGLSHAALDAATTAVCTGDAAEQFANQQIADAGGNASDYVINYNDLKNGNLGKFVTIMCKAAPWQHNGDVYDPYKITKWDAARAEEYAKYAADNVARDNWLRDHGAQPGYPAGSGGKAWCGYKGDGSNNVEWNFMDATPLCPNHDEVKSWNDFYEQSLAPPKVYENWLDASKLQGGYKFAEVTVSSEYQLSFSLKVNSYGNKGAWRGLLNVGDGEPYRYPIIFFTPGTEYELNIRTTQRGGHGSPHWGQEVKVPTGWQAGEIHDVVIKVTDNGSNQGFCNSCADMVVTIDGEVAVSTTTKLVDGGFKKPLMLGNPNGHQLAGVEFTNVEYKAL